MTGSSSTTRTVGTSGTLLAAVGITLLVSSLLTGCSEGSDGSDDAACVPFVFARMVDDERHTAVITATADMEPDRTLTDDGQSHAPAISPDGRSIAYVSGRGSEHIVEHGNEQDALYVMAIDGSDDRRLTPLGADTDPSWSPDGTRIVFTRGRAIDAGTVHVVDVATGRTRRLGPGALARWSPTGEWIAFVADGGLWLMDDRGGSRRRLRDWYGGDFLWSPDGGRIAFLHADGVDDLFVLSTIDVRTGAVQEIPGSRSHSSWLISWTDQDRLYFARNVRGPGVAIMMSRGGHGEPELFRREDDPGWFRMADNPACPP